MKRLREKIRKNTGLSFYVWVVFYILPFYFIYESSSTPQIVFGVIMIVGYLICYVLSFASRGWIVYFWTSIQIAIAIGMSLIFGYIYFFLFLAFLIGNFKNKLTFWIYYSILLISTFTTIYYGFFTVHNQVLTTQLPFVVLVLLL